MQCNCDPLLEREHTDMLTKETATRTNEPPLLITLTLIHIILRIAYQIRH